MAIQRTVSLSTISTTPRCRYVQYFSYVLDGLKPRPGAVILRRVICNGIPDMSPLTAAEERDRERSEAGNSGSSTLGSGIADTIAHVGDAALRTAEVAKEMLRGDYSGEGIAAAADETPVASPGTCRPYLQVFKGSKLIFSSTWTRDVRKDTNESVSLNDDDPSVESSLRWYSPSDGSVRFGDIDIPVTGDILVRCRHFGVASQRETIWRAAFNTGYVQDHVLRLSKHHLDVAAHDDRFGADFWVEFVFAPVTVGETGGVEGEPALEGSMQISASDAAGYETSLEAESALWSDINARKAGHNDASASHAPATYTSPVPRSGVGPTLEEIIAQVPTGTGSKRSKRSTFAATAPAPATVATATTAVKAAPAAAEEPSSPKPKPTPVPVKLEGDLAELEALERELGISSSGASGESHPTTEAAAPTHSSANATAVVPTTLVASEDDVDELEKYLNSLN